MPYIAPEVVQKVKQMDLLIYLKNYEPNELVHFLGNTYTTKTHDSLKISNGKWIWWSRGIDWKQVEEYLKEYIGTYFEIAETSEKIYIGSDFPDEFSHSNDTKKLKGANMKAKANVTPAIGEMIQIAVDKAEYPDYDAKHGSKAKYGWYRYNTRFGLPVYGEDGCLERYNIFTTRMLVRCDEDGKLYLYDLVRTKKETSKPHEP